MLKYFSKHLGQKTFYIFTFLLTTSLFFSLIFSPVKTVASSTLRQVTKNKETKHPTDISFQSAAPNAILMEASTGTILYEKDADKEKPPASVTKIMTLLLIFDALSKKQITLNDTVTVSEHAASMGGSQVFLEPGETQTVDTMIKCIAVSSANDACVAMAEHIYGSEDAFVAKMNARAQALGMKHTHFINCCGLDAEGHYTSARDIALMSRELIIKHPDIFHYTTIWMENITHVTKQGTKEFGLANTNKLLKMAADFQVTGLKTGSTSRAKYCLSATAQKDGIRLIAVIMAAPDYKARFSDARNLLSYGYARCRLYEDKEKMPLPEMKVAGGVKENVLLEAEGTFTWLSTEGEDLGKIEKKLELAEQMEAPLARGERAGMIAYYMDGEKLGELPVVTAEAVEKAGYIDQLQKLFGKWAGFRNKAA